MKIRRLLSLLAVLALSPLAQAQDLVRVTDVWTRATAPGQKVAGVFLEITASVDAKLVAAESPVAGASELHFMRMEDGVMRMRKVEAIALPRGSTVSLKPGGYHVMLFDLKQPLKPGEAVPVVLTVLGAGERPVRIETVANVRNLDGSELHRHH